MVINTRTTFFKTKFKIESKFNVLFQIGKTSSAVHSRVINRAGAFGVRLGLGRTRIWILKNYRASIGPDVGAKSRFSVSDRIFAIAGIKPRKHLVQILLLIRNWCECARVKLNFFLLEFLQNLKRCF